MQNKILRKGLVAGIIILFIAVSVFTSVSSKDISVSDDSIIEDNSKTPLWDEYNEIVAYIKGDGCWYEHDRIAPFLIHGFKFSSGDFIIKAITKNPSNLFLEVTAHKLEVPLFIGTFMGNPDYETAVISGYAVGNFNWEI